MLQKRMFKVLCPIKRGDGGTYWMRLGNAHTNRDESINVYLDAWPAPGTHIQLRELTEDELRERETRRAQYASRTAASEPTTPAQSGIPF